MFSLIRRVCWRRKGSRTGLIAFIFAVITTVPVIATPLSDINGIENNAYINQGKSGLVETPAGADKIKALRQTVEPIDVDTSSTVDKFYIKQYDIEMTVNPDNSYLIHEKIYVHFNEPQHGINRRLPQHNKVRHLDDGTTTDNYARISDIHVTGDKYTTETDDDGNFVLKIGNADKTISGDHTYDIAYKYDIGRDPLPDADELYYNFVGGEWKADIYDANITIHMPESFSTDHMAVYTGPEKATNTKDAIYTVDGNDIYIINKKKLDSGYYLTLRLKLPADYYTYTETAADKVADIWWLVMIVVAGVGLLISFVIWFRRGRDPLTTNVVQYEPPAGLNSAETSMVLSSHIGGENTVSLLLDLANKGYLKISYKDQRKEIVGKTKFGRNIMGKEVYTFTKLKDYDGDKDSERDFLKGLFEKGDSVTKDDLAGSFYHTAETVANSINDSPLHQSLFVDNRSWQWLQIIIIIIISTIMPIIGFAFRGGFSQSSDSAGMAITSIFLLIPAVTALYYCARTGVQSLVVIPFSVGFFVLLIGLFNIGAYSTISLSDTDTTRYTIGIIASEIITCIIAGLAVKTGRRTDTGARLLGEVNGFRDFIQTVEKDRIESLVHDNPNYFYDILPYAYALGVTKVWINKFADIAIQPPAWYDSPGGAAFSIVALDNMVSSTVGDISSSVSSDSGGGDAGGGSGGGGGDSW